MVNKYILSHLNFFTRIMVNANSFPETEGMSIILEIDDVNINTFHFFYERLKKICIYSKINKRIILEDYLEQTKYITLLNTLLDPEEMDIVFLDDIKWDDMFWINSLSQGIPLHTIFNVVMRRDAYDICRKFLNPKGLPNKMDNELASYLGVSLNRFDVKPLEFGKYFNERI